MLKHEIISHVDALPVFFNDYEQGTQLIPSHWHKHFEFVCIKKGSMVITTNHTTYTLHAKDIFVVNSGQIHMTRIPTYAHVILLQIPFETIKKSIPDHSNIQYNPHLTYSDSATSVSVQRLYDLIEEMSQIYDEKEQGYILHFSSKLYELMYVLYSEHTTDVNQLNQTTSEKHLVHLQKAINYMTEHYSSPMTLKDITTYLALNPEYFCRLFKKHMGQTFLEYLNQIRLVHIFNDLKNTDMTITALQQKHGFTNYKLFNRMFKATYGCVPSEIRKNGIS